MPHHVSYAGEDVSGRSFSAFTGLKGRLLGACLTDPGGREENQDAWGCAKCADGGWLFCVADGLGGHKGGREAARAAVAGALGAGEAKGFLSTSAQSLANLFEAAQQAVRGVAREQRLPEMRAALAVLCVKDETAFWGHTGDVRIYRARQGGEFAALTKDQSVPQMLADAGEIDPVQIRRHPDRNRLLYVLGGESIRPVLAAAPEPVAPGDAFLLLTDGFWEWLEDDELAALALKADAPAALKRAEDVLRLRAGRPEGGHDNYSAVLLRFVVAENADREGA